MRIVVVLLLSLFIALPAFSADPALLLRQAIGDQRLVLLGEMHGTREIPEITANLVAEYAAKGPVVLALEADAADQLRVDRFLRSDGSTKAYADLMLGHFWQEPMHDGRDSVAMQVLLERVRQLRKAGGDIDVVLFDAAGEGDRDARMAAAIRAALIGRSEARVLVLTGNVHAMTGEPPQMLSDGKPYVPPKTVGRHLADLSPLSIVFRAKEGTFWACRGGECGEQHIQAGGAMGDLPRVERNGADGSWMLTMLLPRFTASPPAVDHH